MKKGIFFVIIFSQILCADILSFSYNQKVTTIIATGEKIKIKNKTAGIYRLVQNNQFMIGSNKMFVHIKDDDKVSEIRKQLKQNNIYLSQKIKRTNNWYLAYCSEDSIVAINRMKQSKTFDLIPDFYRYVDMKEMVKPNDILFPNQWHLLNTGQEGTTGEDARVYEAWNILKDNGFKPGENVVIGIIDDGFDLNHEDMVGKYLSGYDFYDDDDVPHIGPYDFHGTAVAGVAAAVTDNNIGVAGTCPHCRIIPVRISGALLDGVTEIEAFNYLLDRGVNIISNSWGPADRAGAYDMPEPLKEIIDYAVSEERNGKGVVVLFAAGNGNESISDQDSFDGYAAYKNVIAVGSSNADGIKASYSDWGEDLDVVAPSCEYSADDYFDPFLEYKIKHGIWTTDNMGFAGFKNGGYESEFCGTSSSTPLVAGVIGLIISACPDLSWQEIYTIITETADKIGTELTEYNDGFNKYYGSGRINAVNAVETALATGRCSGLENLHDEETYPIDADYYISDVDIQENLDRDIYVDFESSLIPEYENSGCGCMVIN